MTHTLNYSGSLVLPLKYGRLQVTNEFKILKMRVHELGIFSTFLNLWRHCSWQAWACSWSAVADSVWRAKCGAKPNCSHQSGTALKRGDLFILSFDTHHTSTQYKQKSCGEMQRRDHFISLYNKMCWPSLQLWSFRCNVDLVSTGMQTLRLSTHSWSRTRTSSRLCQVILLEVVSDNCTGVYDR